MTIAVHSIAIQKRAVADRAMAGGRGQIFGTGLFACRIRARVALALLRAVFFFCAFSFFPSLSLGAVATFARERERERKGG